MTLKFVGSNTPHGRNLKNSSGQMLQRRANQNQAFFVYIYMGLNVFG